MKRLVLILILFAAVSCRSFDFVGMIAGQSPDADVRFEESGKAGTSLSITASSDNYKLYAVTDIHADGSAPRLQKYVSEYLSDSKAEKFSLCLGDLTMAKEQMPMVYGVLEPLNSGEHSLYVSPGNHDIMFGQWSEFLKYWKRGSYTVTVSTVSGIRDLYICLDSAGGTLGRAQREWLESTLESAGKSSFRNIIVFTHTNLFTVRTVSSTSSSFNQEETQDLLHLFGEHKVSCVLCGHEHCHGEVTFKGVRYYTLSALVEKEDSGSYYVFEIGDDIVCRQKIL